MKKNFVIIFISLGFTYSCTFNRQSESNQYSDTTQKWIEEFKDLTIPSKYVFDDSINNDSLVHIYFKYRQLVKGYEVTGKWFPYDKYSEIGFAFLNFVNKETGFNMLYMEPRYSSYDLNRIVDDKAFNGHNNDDIYIFDYTASDTLSQELYPGSPINYYSSFQFLDVDFDGKDELLISDWSRTQAGNWYNVIKILDDGKTKHLGYIPLDRLTNVDRIDIKNQTITIVDFDGACDYAEFYFSHKKRTRKITERPKFYSECATRFDFEKYNNELGCPFVLDSIKENAIYVDNEHHVTYIVTGNKIIQK